ncbi:hypothetical protein TrST_g13165 [Triparma strigata]|uniref:Uncharacterized protein n=1 Tax=Triparma strigata TaxID=1606541 RepID=A0A9W7BH48_9STRA|nr:hypothetical protein TrST_g13165 [Triparma strigata]
MIDLEMGEGGGSKGRSTNPMHEKKKLERGLSEKKFKKPLKKQTWTSVPAGIGRGSNANASEGVIPEDKPFNPSGMRGVNIGLGGAEVGARVGDFLGLNRGESVKAFGKVVKQEAGRVAGKGIGGGGGASAKAGVGGEALGKVIAGGGASLERLNIGINYLQNFGLVALIDVPWPDSFRGLFAFVRPFSFNLDLFGGYGNKVTIAAGLLVPIWLCVEFDAGLFYERDNFNFWWMGQRGRNFVAAEDTHVATREKGAFRGGKIGFAAVGLLAVVVCVLAIVNIAEDWIGYEMANSFILVLAGLGLLSFFHQFHLWRQTKRCSLAKEDFGRKQQENEMFFFLFFYTVAYLSGVSACMKLFVAEDTVEKVFGGILLPFYTAVPLWGLIRCAKAAKTAVKEVASEEGYSFRWDREGYLYKDDPTVSQPRYKADNIGKGKVTAYKESLGEFSKKAAKSKTHWVTHVTVVFTQRLTRVDPGYIASVIAVLIASYEEKFWFWKEVLMGEKALLAIVVHANISSWLAVGVAGVGWILSVICRPYWDRVEDLLDNLARLTTLATIVAAALIEKGVLRGDEGWLGGTLCGLSGLTFLTLLVATRPDRLGRGAWKTMKKGWRADLIQLGEGGISKLTEEQGREITEEEFFKFSKTIQGQLVARFGTVVLTFGKLDSESIKVAVKAWLMNSEEAEAKFGPISEWDVSEVRSMKGLFKDAKWFNADISGWNVESVRDMAYMFSGASSFDSDLPLWDVREVKDMSYMIEGALAFNKDSLNKWKIKPFLLVNPKTAFSRVSSYVQGKVSWTSKKLDDEGKWYSSMCSEWNESLGNNTTRIFDKIGSGGEWFIKMDDPLRYMIIDLKEARNSDGLLYDNPAYLNDPILPSGQRSHSNKRSKVMELYYYDAEAFEVPSHDDLKWRKAARWEDTPEGDREVMAVDFKLVKARFWKYHVVSNWQTKNLNYAHVGKICFKFSPPLPGDEPYIGPLPGDRKKEKEKEKEKVRKGG